MFQTKRGQQCNFSKFQVFCPIFQKKKFLSQSFLGGASYGLVYICHWQSKFLTWRYTTDSRPILRRQSMVNVLAECPPIHQPRYLQIVGRYVDHLSADIRWSISRPTYRPTLDRYADRYIGRESVDMSVEGCTKYTWSDPASPDYLTQKISLVQKEHEKLALELELLRLKRE